MSLPKLIVHVRHTAVVCAIVCSVGAPAQPAPDGYDWVTIGDPGNIGYDRPHPNNRILGWGAVAYEYRITRTEVTTAQWAEFLNAVFRRSVPLPLDIETPIISGIEADPNYHGPGVGFRVSPSIPNAAMLPATGMEWRTCAILCNWLHNGKRTEPWAFTSGVYDTRTFGYRITDSGITVFTDQETHSPGALYWIPSVHEWLKAAAYDPNKFGPGAGGWWEMPNRSDIPLLHAPPETGDANVCFELPNEAQFRIPLRAYGHITSFYGLFDLAGASQEFTETAFLGFAGRYRGALGSQWNHSWCPTDEVYRLSGWFPTDSDTAMGLRLASPASGWECQTSCPVADFNCDGGVDGADVEVFFTVWMTGESRADANRDGGVDGADVEAFFRVWEAGGC